MSSISLKRLFPLLLVLIVSSSTLSAQIQTPTTRDNPNVMAQVKSLLASKGLSEQEVKERLKAKGLNIDSMSDAEIAQNRSVIEQTIAELEAEKKKSGGTMNAEPGKVIPFDAAMPEKQGTSKDTTYKEPLVTKAEAIADSIQKKVALKAKEVGIYGHDIFTNQTLDAFRTTDGARTPDTYILGAGDRIRITIFGMSQSDLLLEINKEGYIQPTGLKQLYLQGVSLGEARKLIGQRFSAAYRFQQDQYAVTLQTARAITVNVFGETNLRGSFNMSALNTAFNALSVAGGPTMQGSVRNIELIRGKSRKKMDVYAFLSDPAFQFQFDIQQNDILYVPMAQKVVALEGAVKRPMKYELAGKEGLTELMAFAGGVNFNTYPEYLQIERAQADSVILLEYKLSDVLSKKISVDLADGDIVRVRNSKKPLERFTEVEGAVYYPGRYELQKDMRLSALLMKVQLMPEAKNDFFFVERLLRDSTVRILKVNAADAGNFVLEPRDRVQVYNKIFYANQEMLEVEGAVRLPVKRMLAFGDKIPVMDAIQLAGGVLPTATDLAQVIRTDVMTPGKVEYIPVNLTNVKGLELQAGDKLVVFDKRTFVQGATVSISGAVKDTLTTLYNPTLSVGDLIRLAGGFTQSAALNRVDVFRLGYGENGTGYTRFEIEVDTAFNVIAPNTSFNLMPFDKIAVRSLPLFNLNRTVKINGGVKYPGLYALEAKEVHLSNIIKQAGGLSAIADKKFATLYRTQGTKGLIGIDLEKAIARSGSRKFDPTLLPGDSISIPDYQNTVGIRVKGTRQADMVRAGTRLDQRSLTEVVNFMYANQRSAGWYIREYAGGFSRKADKKSVAVSYPDGSARGTKKVFFFFRKYPSVKPGAVVSLNEHEEKAKDAEGKKVNWDNVFSKILAVGTTMAVLITATK
jgi:protein involved in polysaccharide export with SLBB domain